MDKSREEEGDAFRKSRKTEKLPVKEMGMKENDIESLRRKIKESLKMLDKMNEGFEKQERI